MSDFSHIRHVAFIMDGNRRWARQAVASLKDGYNAGMEKLEEVVLFLSQVGIKGATFFAFSSENWKRPKQEISLLQDVVEGAFERFLDFAHKQEVQVRIIGDFHLFRPGIRDFMQQIITETKHYRSMSVQVAAGYGGMQDIVCAVERWRAAGSAEPLTPDVFASYLQSAALGPVDLLIRTGGQQRLSNFLLWQCAYAELFFLKEYWPALTTSRLEEVFSEYGGIQRNFGA